MKDVAINRNPGNLDQVEPVGVTHLFLTHVGSPGGAEHKMLSIASQTEGAHAMTFQCGILQEMFATAGVPISVLEIPENLQNIRRESGLLSIIKSVPAALKMAVKLIRAARQFDVLVPMSQKSFVLLALSRPFVRRPIIWYMNDLVSEQHFSPTLISLIKIIAKYGADHIFFNSEASRTAWIATGGRASRTSISFPGRDVDSLDSLLRDVDRTKAIRDAFSPEGMPLVTVVGRISRWKGQDVFLKALYRVEGVRGVIVGDALFGETEFYSELRELVINLGIENRVIFAGHREDVPNILAASDVVVHCSTSPEPFGAVIVEAMMCGTPIVAANEGGPTEIVIDGVTGQLTTPGAEEELAEAIRRYLFNPDWSKQLAAAARERAVELYSSKAMVNRHKAAVSRFI